MTFPSLLSSVPRLGKSAVLCIGTDLRRNAEAWREAALPCVALSEIGRAQRFRQPLDAIRHLIGRALVRTLLARELGMEKLLTEFTTNPWGKPALPGCGIEFSITHSGTAVFAAFCRGIPVGIDIEKEDRYTDLHALSDLFHPAERAELLVLSMRQARTAFFRCWTRKEAIVKALGKGLSNPLSGFRVHTGDCISGWLIEAPQPGGVGWTTADLPVCRGNHVSIAAMAPGLSLSCFHLQGHTNIRPQAISRPPP